MKRTAWFSLATFLLVGAGAWAAESGNLNALERELHALRAQNAVLQRENAELKAKLGEANATSVKGRQEDTPKNRIKLPSNVTINHNPR